MVLNILILTTALIFVDTANLNNYIKNDLWVDSIAGVLSARKRGFAFAIFALGYTLSTSVALVINNEIWINTFRIIINIPIIIYFFRRPFESKTKWMLLGKRLQD